MRIIAFFEFCNINQEYQGKPYKYAYMVKNYARTNGSIVKLNVEEGTVIEKLLPDGLFPTGDKKFFVYYLSTQLLFNSHYKASIYMTPLKIGSIYGRLIKYTMNCLNI